jgi:hypothetical protein
MYPQYKIIIKKIIELYIFKKNKVVYIQCTTIGCFLYNKNKNFTQAQKKENLTFQLLMPMWVKHIQNFYAFLYASWKSQDGRLEVRSTFSFSTAQNLNNKKTSSQ